MGKTRRGFLADGIKTLVAVLCWPGKPKEAVEGDEQEDQYESPWPDPDVEYGLGQKVEPIAVQTQCSSELARHHHLCWPYPTDPIEYYRHKLLLVKECGYGFAAKQGRHLRVPWGGPARLIMVSLDYAGEQEILGYMVGDSGEYLFALVKDATHA